jgi:hypothetical protein
MKEWVDLFNEAVDGVKGSALDFSSWPATLGNGLVSVRPWPPQRLPCRGILQRSRTF